MFSPILTSIFSKEGVKKSIVINLKDKIDEKTFNDTLVKIGLNLISIEIKNSDKSDTYNFFKFEEEINITDIAPVNIMWLDAKNSCININIQTVSGIFREIGGGLTKGYFGSIFNTMKKANMENLGNELEKQLTHKDFIGSLKEILFREKILDEVYDKSEEYKKNIEKYEANTDDIIEKIEEEKEEKNENRGSIGSLSQPQEDTAPYDLFIIKHFIKFVMDKYKQENISSEDNSTNENIENTEDTKNISNNPFINDGE
ncbi:hypothetical protein [Brachyspira sp.]|uniref:hypothetical protein n=1 Tax=Brachyspira sp. TaxID=1977261 RepID=UPI003D7C5C0C